MIMKFLADAPGIINDFANLGAAGFMGAMWLWERRTSQKREEQLDESHTRIMGDHVQLEQLISVVRDNTQALSRLTTTHEQLLRQLNGDGRLTT
jgi:hypothetical protein